MTEFRMIDRLKTASVNTFGALPLSILASVFLCCPLIKAQTSEAAQRALLDQYCVTCHNDKVKTANLSLQSSDIKSVADHPELWEQVIRKLRPE